jgi:hypothetical protein
MDRNIEWCGPMVRHVPDHGQAWDQRHGHLSQLHIAHIPNAFLPPKHTIVSKSQIMSQLRMRLRLLTCKFMSKGGGRYA